MADLPAYQALIIFAGAAVAVGYAAILHFFSYEQFLRPVVEDIVEDLPSSFTGAPVGVPLRWKLLGALPLINVITGVVVSGLSTNGDASLHDLGLDVVVAVLVAFTISLELTVLVTRSVLQPVDRLLEATEAVKQGDLDARVPITSGDELGQLAGSFNEMMDGLSEREALREAFGAYVDPDVAERVLEEGELIEGQEREVTVMILDVCDFTEFARALERARDGRVPQRPVRDRGAVRDRAWRPREQVPRRRAARGVRRARAARRPRGPRRRGRARASRRALAERFGEEVRFGIGVNSGPGGDRLGGRRRPARVRGDRRPGERRGARGAPHAGDGRHDPDHRGDPLPNGSGPNHWLRTRSREASLR